MRKIAEFRSKRDHYEADACIVWCFDDRFFPALKAFIALSNYKHEDVIHLAGGARSLALPEDDPSCKFLLGQIATSIKLHNPKTVVLMLHSDCGAYGGLAAFGGGSQQGRVKEFMHHRNDLKRARKLLRKRLPRSVPIRLIFVDFENIWEV